MRLLFGLVLIIMNDVPRLRYIFRQRRKPHTAEQCSEQMSGGVGKSYDAGHTEFHSIFTSGVNNETLYRLKNEAAVQGIVLEGVLVYEL